MHIFMQWTIFLHPREKNLNIVSDTGTECQLQQLRWIKCGCKM